MCLKIWNQKYARVRLNQILYAYVCGNTRCGTETKRIGMGMGMGTGIEIWIGMVMVIGMRWDAIPARAPVPRRGRRESRRVTQFSFNWSLRWRWLSWAGCLTNLNPSRREINYAGDDDDDDDATNCRMKYGFLWHWAHFTFQVGLERLPPFQLGRWTAECRTSAWIGLYSKRMEKSPLLISLVKTNCPSENL